MNRTRPSMLALLIVCLVGFTGRASSAYSTGRPGSTRAAVHPQLGKSCGLTVTPDQPTVDDVIQVTASGIWHDSCVPNSALYHLDGYRVRTVAAPDYPPGTFCLEVFGLPWSVTVDVGPLPGGIYIVELYVPFYPDGTRAPCATRHLVVHDSPGDTLHKAYLALVTAGPATAHGRQDARHNNDAETHAGEARVPNHTLSTARTSPQSSAPQSRLQAKSQPIPR